MHTHVAGVALPVSPGFEHILLAPKVSMSFGPASAMSKVQSPYGEISMSWARRLPGTISATSEGGVDFSIKLPKPATLEVDIGMMSSSSKFDFIVREHGNVVWNGKFVPGVDGVKGAQFDGQVFSVFTARGHFDFEVRMM